jgi:hypothetical protein
MEPKDEERLRLKPGRTSMVKRFEYCRGDFHETTRRVARPRHIDRSALDFSMLKWANGGWDA